jgi:hypothetical protein
MRLLSHSCQVIAALNSYWPHCCSCLQDPAKARLREETTRLTRKIAAGNAEVEQLKRRAKVQAKTLAKLKKDLQALQDSRVSVTTGVRSVLAVVVVLGYKCGTFVPTRLDPEGCVMQARRKKGRCSLPWRHSKRRLKDLICRKVGVLLLVVSYK